MSIRSVAARIGTKKARAMSAWAERRGIATTIAERLFDDGFQRRPDEPAIVPCGMDIAAGCRALDQVGFDFFVEAGFGRGRHDFRSLLVHTLPGELQAAEIWKEQAGGNQPADEAAAYKKMLDEGSIDRCGVTLLPGKAVGAPFVGAVAATLVLAEVLRRLHGDRLHRLVDVNLVDLDHFRVAPQLRDFTSMNSGFAMAVR